MTVSEISISLTGIKEYIADQLSFLLDQMGFTGFYETESVLHAYISTELFNRDSLNLLLRELGIPENNFSENVLPEKNWNEVWESNFEPVRIGRCLIRAPFHKPDTSADPEIVIEPKMSFGTGHHATTSLMISEMFSAGLPLRKILDAGCGTGILAILAEKLGASEITAIDIDEWSYRNAQENILRNDCKKIRLLHGDLSLLKDQSFDVIAANINLSIHLSNLGTYSAMCNPQGSLLLSGILSSDIQALKIETQKHGFAFISNSIRDNWALIRFAKI